MVDLRTLSPLDIDLIARCVRATGRVVVVHEAPKTLGLGAEVTARIVEEAFDFLEAPVRRVTGWDVPYPPASLEERYLPGVDRIAAAVAEVVATDDAERSSRCRTSARGSRKARSSSGWSPKGTTVELNQPLVEVETAKATVEIPSPFAGAGARALHGAVGATVGRRGTAGDVRHVVRRRSRSSAPARPRRRCASSRGSWGSTSRPSRGRGPDGRITADDVRSAVRRRRGAARRRGALAEWRSRRDLERHRRRSRR